MKDGGEQHVEVSHVNPKRNDFVAALVAEVIEAPHISFQLSNHMTGRDFFRRNLVANPLVDPGWVQRQLVCVANCARNFARQLPDVIDDEHTLRVFALNEVEANLLFVVTN